MFASEPGVTNDGVWINFHQSTSLSHAIAFDDVFDDGNDGIFGQSGAEKNGALVFGKTFFANPALEQAGVIFAIGVANKDIVASSDALFGADFMRAVKLMQIVHDYRLLNQVLEK